MEIVFTPEALEHLRYWKKSGNKAIQKKIDLLLKDIVAQPYQGIGKPEALRYELSGKWSRRIDKEHRLVYDVVEDQISIYSLIGHY